MYMYTKVPYRICKKSLLFLKEVLPPPATILDLGVRNPFSEIMENNGYRVLNTNGEDLDLSPENLTDPFLGQLID